jgi:hypothetical protein
MSKRDAINIDFQARIGALIKKGFFELLIVAWVQQSTSCLMNKR